MIDPVTFSPCLIRFVSEYARNLARTDKTVSFRLLLAVRAPTHTESPKCHRGGKRTWPDRDSDPGSLAYRANNLPLSYRITCRPVTFLPCLIKFVPKAARNHAGTNETVYFRLLLAAKAQTLFTALTFIQPLIHKVWEPRPVTLNDMLL